MTFYKSEGLEDQALCSSDVKVSQLVIIHYSLSIEYFVYLA